MKFIKDFFKGIFIGAGAILPGISSGVLCVIFGIYDKLVESILNIFKDFKKNFFYLLPIVLGCFIGVFLLGNILSVLLNSYSMQTKYAFIGLILGSIPLILKKVNETQKFRLNYIFYTFIAFLIGIFAVILEHNIDNNILVVSTNALLLFIAGFFMSIGIVVPGVSSTLILMCFGIYNTYLQAISTMNLSILIPLGLGVISGSIIFLKIIKYLLDHYYMQTFYSIIGFTLGSILVLYEPLTFNPTGIISILLLIICFYLAGFLKKKEG